MTVILVESNNTVLQQGSGDSLVTQAAPAGTIVQTGLLGPVSTSTDKSYRHDQNPASAIWSISHNLGKYPSVTIVDSAGDEVEGSVNHVSSTTVVVSFSAAFSGSAFLN